MVKVVDFSPANMSLHTVCHPYESLMASGHSCSSAPESPTLHVGTYEPCKKGVHCLNNTNICKVHIVSIGAESEAPSFQFLDR